MRCGAPHGVPAGEQGAGPSGIVPVLPGEGHRGNPPDAGRPWRRVRGPAAPGAPGTQLRVVDDLLSRLGQQPDGVDGGEARLVRPALASLAIAFLLPAVGLG